MAKEKMVFFRTSLGGFNREDVNGYIEKLNSEFAERERMMKKKIDAADAKCAELDNKNKVLEGSLARLEQLEAEASAREKVIAEYAETTDKLNSEIQSLKDEKDAANSEIEKLNEMINSLSDTISKSEKYDGISGQIGEIILSARSTAEDIIEHANAEAAAKLKDADKAIEEAAASFNARAATAAYAVKGHIKKLARDSYVTLAEKAADTSDMLRNLASHIGEVAESFDDSVSSAKTDTELAIENEAAKLFPESSRLAIK